jgi:hypothetical protein
LRCVNPCEPLYDRLQLIFNALCLQRACRIWPSTSTGSCGGEERRYGGHGGKEERDEDE